MSELLTTEQAADLLGITPTALQGTRSRGNPPGKLGFRRGRNIWYRRDDLEAYAEGRLETFGAQDAIVIELRGVNNRLQKLLNELHALRAEKQERIEEE